MMKLFKMYLAEMGLPDGKSWTDLPDIITETMLNFKMEFQRIEDSKRAQKNG